MELFKIKSAHTVLWRSKRCKTTRSWVVLDLLGLSVLLNLLPFRRQKASDVSAQSFYSLTRLQAHKCTELYPTRLVKVFAKNEIIHIFVYTCTSVPSVILRGNIYRTAGRDFSFAFVNNAYNYHFTNIIYVKSGFSFYFEASTWEKYSFLLVDK